MTRAVVLLLTALPGLLFAPVFGFWALVLPVLAAGVVCFGVAELCDRRRALRPWRPVIAAVLGLVVVLEVVLRGTVSPGEALHALVAGVTDSWRLTLQTTWPAPADPALVLFVPLLVLAASVLAVELLGRRPLLALLPSLPVLVLSQAFGALTGATALVVGAAYAALVVLLLVLTGPDRPSAPSRLGAVLLAAVPVVVLGAVGVVAGGVADPAGTPAFSLQDNQPAPLPPGRVANPLTEVAGRLLHPEVPVFRYSSGTPVDRWRLAVLDRFNGVTWSPGGEPRRLGAPLPAPAAPPSDLRTADVTVFGSLGPWLPSQPLVSGVDGVTPFVDAASGQLRLPGPADGAAYRLRWWEPTGQAGLLGRGVDPAAARDVGDVGAVPPEVTTLARGAVRDMRPSFQTALLLEKYFSDNYRVVRAGERLPTGSGWPQLKRFLLETHVGTSEQFAAAYVAVAKLLGIPARVAVGFRSPAGAGRDVVVRNADVLAWPEVAVDGVGWVALDPTGAAAASGGLGDTTARARAALPPPDQVTPPRLPSSGTGASAPDTGLSVPWPVFAVLLTVLVVLWLVGVPAVGVVRAWRRRRRPGYASVAGAWAEARDRLRAHGVVLTPGMTVRDALSAVGPSAPAGVREGLSELAGAMDAAMWTVSASDERERAWAAVRKLRRGLGKARPGRRVLAWFDPRGLRPSRA
ncbi:MULTISPECIES: transglutaminase family protein [unclassified Amycolatopsis]|uniref:transglutaminase family protein n=1 Tax=unclassified Amycolatopsis TaxID=2618356 RepID=UPI002E1B3F94|nr:MULTISPECIES: transglutaminaseTgpA domain-containing protein [unclassified Amycolatopsis]